VNIQDAREWLKTTIAGLDTGNVWEITLATWPKLSATHTIDIGHAAPTPDTFRRRRVDLPVRWWVNEANEDDSVRNLYEALSFAPGSIIAQLLDLDDVVRAVVVEDVGPELFGPTGWLRAETTITVLIDGTDESS
jgi:hypothetical protein